MLEKSNYLKGAGDYILPRPEIRFVGGMLAKVMNGVQGFTWPGADLIIPYAGADSRIFGAAVPLHDLRRLLEAKASAV